MKGIRERYRLEVRPDHPGVARAIRFAASVRVELVKGGDRVPPLEAFSIMRLARIRRAFAIDTHVTRLRQSRPQTL